MPLPALDAFLASVERRAFGMARLATRNEADALDIVQEAMLKLTASYRDRDAGMWRPLFFRILENCIMDWHRREGLRRRWFFWRAAPAATEAGEDDTEVWDKEANPDAIDPVEHLAVERAGAAFLAAVEGLPLQQQQCFLLRCWEGLSVDETAEALGIQPGSVKTHLFRAMQKLNEVALQHDTAIP